MSAGMVLGTAELWKLFFADKTFHYLVKTMCLSVLLANPLEGGQDKFFHLFLILLSL